MAREWVGWGASSGSRSSHVGGVSNSVRERKTQGAVLVSRNHSSALNTGGWKGLGGSR